jgi:carbonic anhydrase/acetyltransferase-like protein (isoleucine patch superfamily)
MIYAFKGFIPVVDPTSFVHPQATVTGNVIIGKHCYIGPGAALRGDWGGIVLEDGCNVQENCTIHMFPGVTVRLEAGAHIGHGAIIHGASIGANAMVGMNAVVMDDVKVGAGSIIGALSFVKAATELPPRSLVVGNPARIVGEVSDAMLAWKTKGTRLYQMLPAELQATLVACEPLREVPADRPSQDLLYATWEAIKGEAQNDAASE